MSELEESAPVFVAPPLRIGGLEFGPPVLPAPMCGISDRAWRILSREQGCPLVYTQMASSEAMIRGARKCWDLLDMDASEAPICVQLFGSDPEVLARTARMVQDRGATIVDLNMGCPVNKVVKSKGGAALMREPELVRRIFRAMRGALDVPFTVKFRAGWEKYGEEALGVARMAEEEGLDGIAIHARTREQQFKGRADWSILREVKRQVRIPVIGNGDIRCGEDAVRMMSETGVDGVMIGRAGMGNPWLFGEVCARVSGLAPPAPPTVAERLEMVGRHARIMVARKGDRGLVEFRKHIVQYLRGFHEARSLKTGLLGLRDLGELLAELERAAKEAADWEEARPASPVASDGAVQEA